MLTIWSKLTDDELFDKLCDVIENVNIKGDQLALSFREDQTEEETLLIKEFLIRQEKGIRNVN